VRSYRTFSPLPDPGLPPAIGGSFSVALFLASRRTGVTRHPSLWSPDFPLPAVRTTDPARFGPPAAAA